MSNAIVEFVRRVIVPNLGYRNTIRYKDTFLFIAGIFLGGIIMSLLTGNLFYKVNKVNSKVYTCWRPKFQGEGSRHYFANPRNFYEAVESLLILTFAPFFTKREYTRIDENRTRRFIFALAIVGFLFIIISIFLIGHPIMPTTPIK